MNCLTNVLVNTFFVVAIVDAANIFTGLKTKIFIILLMFLVLTHNCGLQKKYFRKFGIIVLISVICYLCGRIYGYPSNDSFFVQYTMAFSLLLILVWERYIHVEKGMWVAANLLAYGTIMAYLLCFIYPQFKPLIENFANKNEGGPVIYISSRTFLGMNFDGVFYTPLAFVVLPCSIALYRLFNHDGSYAYNLYLALLFSFALFCGGNRACLMCIAILWGGFGIYMVVRKYPFLKVFILPICFIGILCLFFAFMQEKGEDSNETKQLHLLAYKQLLQSNPLVFITGMGAGSKVYSPGFMQKTELMEWTYLELFRLYGVFSLYVLYVFYGPVYTLWKRKRAYKYGIPVALGSFLYMVSSYGNPYLINSTGFCLLIYLYSYIGNCKSMVRK